MKKLFLKRSFISSIQPLQKGFTLIELLIVITILGVLAAVVIVAINPLEQLARSRDAGRVSSVGQLGHAMQAYVTNQGSTTYPSPSATWQTTLQSSGEIQNLVNVPAANPNCSTFAQGNICYQTYNTNQDAVVWTILESKSNYAKAGCSGSQVPAVAWISSVGKAGLTCVTSADTPVTNTATLK